MENLEDKTKEEILKLRDEGKSCSQATLIGICRAAGLKADEHWLSAIAAGFRGGIGGTHDEGTCGALSGAVLAMGLLSEGDGNLAAKQSRQLYKAFKQQQGAVACKMILGKNGAKNCTECCLCAGTEAAKLIKKVEEGKARQAG